MDEKDKEFAYNVIKALLVALILTILCYSITVWIWVSKAYDYELPVGDNNNTNIMGGLQK